MALAFVSSTVSANTAVATAVPVPYPASVAINNTLVLLVGTKPFSATITTPAGWTALGEITNGSVAGGVDTGSVKMAAFILPNALGTETGNLTVAITSGNASYGSMYRYTKAAGFGVQSGFASGTDGSAGTNWTVSYSSNPGITTGDHLVVGGIWPSDAANTISANALAATSATITAISPAAGDQNPRVSVGNQCGGNTAHTACTAGTASANGTWSSTHTLATNNGGSAVLVRLREVQAVQSARSPYIVHAQAIRRSTYY